MMNRLGHGISYIKLMEVQTEKEYQILDIISDMFVMQHSSTILLFRKISIKHYLAPLKTFRLH